MLNFSTLRAFYRIPLIYNNIDAIHFLSNTFHLLIALYRAKRNYEFFHLKNIFISMIDSFAQYNNTEAKATLELLIQIPWFKLHQQDLYRAIVSYNRIIQLMQEHSYDDHLIASQPATLKDVEEFMTSLKKLIQFGDSDEVRIKNLLENPELMDELYWNIMESFKKNYDQLDYSTA